MVDAAPETAVELRFLSLITKNPNNVVLLERLAQLGLNDAWLVSGCLFQTAWNVMDGRRADLRH